MPLRSVSHEGRETAFRFVDRGGSKSPVVFIHGAGGTHEVWREQFELAESRPIVAVDLSGHGKSQDIQAVPGWETLAAYASDTQAVIDITQPSTIVGHSLGAAVAIHAVANRDVSIDRLVVIGTGTRLPVHDHLLYLLEHDFESFVEFVHGQDRLYYRANQETLESSARSMRSCGQSVTYRDFRTCNELDLRDEVGKITSPVLAICGDHDKITPPEVHDRLVANVAHGEVTCIDEAGHMVMIDRPAAVNATLREFFDREFNP